MTIRYCSPQDLSEYVKEDELWLRDPVIEHWDISGGLPVDPADGDRYISDGTDEELGWYDGYIYEYDEEDDTWYEEIPIEGWMVWMLFELVFWVFFSGGWMEIGSGTYVPYEGAVDDVDLGAHTLTTTSTIKSGGFSVGATPGIDTTFIDNDGNTITVTKGLVTAKTSP